MAIGNKKCQYKFTILDNRKNPKHIPGELCGAAVSSESADGTYCQGHLIKLGLGGEKEEKRKKNQKIGHKIRKEKQEKIIKYVTNPDVSQEKIKKSKDLYSFLVGDTDFDLARVVAEAKEDKEVWENGKKRKVSVFLMWVLADPETRRPRLMLDAAKILGIKELELREWMDSNWLFDDIEAHQKRVVQLFMPSIMKKLLVNAMAGDMKATQVVVNYAKKFSNVGAEDSPLNGIVTDKDKEMAKDVIDTETRERGIYSRDYSDFEETYGALLGETTQ